MSRRTFCVEVERTVTCRRKVWVEVEETAGRLKDSAAGAEYAKHVFSDDAKFAAEDKAKTKTLTGWESVSTEYHAGSAVETVPGGNVDVVT